jgi:malic enzyme
MEAIADRIDSPMKLAAARAIADATGEDELLPDPLDRTVHEREAASER